MRQRWWVPLRRDIEQPGGPDRPMLLGIGHAGAGTRPYRVLAALLPGWRTRALRLPGRESRLAELPLSDVDEVLAALVPETRATVGAAPYMLVGACSGAVLAAALAEALPADVAPRGLAVLGCVAPHLRRAQADVDEETARHRLLADGTTPPEVLDDEEYGPRVVATYQADMRLARRRRIRLAAPISVLAAWGSADELSASAVKAWREVTTGPFHHLMVDGAGHLLLGDAPADIAVAVQRLLGDTP